MIEIFLRTFLNRIDWLGNRIIRFIRFCFQEQQLEYFALFGPVPTHLELESYTVAFFWVPYSLRNVLKKLYIFSQSARLVGKLNQLIRWVFCLGIA